MAIGVRQQFDLAGVALAMGSAGLSPKIKLDNPLERRLVSDIAVAGMTSVVRGRFDVESLATQLISDAAAVGIQQQQTQPISEDYHQSQKASRGAGQITQTTIEQQWESQLINNAELTAHMQLPSITFDVNNSYVSQQLGQRVGEEVSHFYHPTPPPRNPSGFWQRVEQRYKNEFERQALIAEGRAAANSEVMSESLGYASANQQHYLDLGYTDNVAQTRAGLLAATELPLPLAAKGIIQASRLMNRWGLFNSKLDLTELSTPDINLPKHPLEGWTAEQVIQHANQLGLKTERDQLLLWSGLGKNGVTLSQEYALAYGGTTLEMTPGGKWLNEMDLFSSNSPFTERGATEIWENISMATMRLASGQVRSVLGQVNPRSIYSQEIQELLNNDKVLGLEPLYIKPKYIFGK